MAYTTQWANYDPNKFMCEYCFKILDVVECAVIGGQKYDVCVPCQEREEELKILRSHEKHSL